MKKFLLFTAIGLVATTAFAGDDITPAGYKFNTAKSVNIFPNAVLGANFNNYSVPIWTSIKGDDYYDGGLLAIAGGAYTSADNTYFADNKKGISLVDLGGTVGQVLCINGANSDFNEYFTNLLGREINAPKQGANVNWFNYNWFADPKNTPTTKITDDKSNPLPTSDGTYIRVRMTFSIYSSIPAEGDGVMKMYMVGNQNNQMPLQDSSGDSYNKVHSSKFAKWDDDEQDYVWSDDEELQYDPTRWQVLEWDTWCKSPDSDGTTYGPIRLKCESTQGTINNKTILIKSLEFIANPVSEVSDPIIKDRKWTAIKLEPGEASQSGVNEVAVAEDNTNAAVEYFNLNGVQVNGENLSAGVYVRRQGNKVEKVVIK